MPNEHRSIHKQCWTRMGPASYGRSRAAGGASAPARRRPRTPARRPHVTYTSPTELAARIGSGLLSFPVPHFREADLSFDEDAYRDNIAHLGHYDAAVAAAPQGVPVLAPAGYGTATAAAMAAAAERAGADGVLLFPPYLTEADQDGLAAHVRAVCSATSLGVVVYARANAVYAADTL